jgi:hypothetical protein
MSLQEAKRLRQSLWIATLCQGTRTVLGFWPALPFHVPKSSGARNVRTIIIPPYVFPRCQYP